MRMQAETRWQWRQQAQILNSTHHSGEVGYYYYYHIAHTNTQVK